MLKKRKNEVKNMAFSKLKKRKGQIRGIDFTISLVLFIILFSQLILVIFNARVTLVKQIEKEENAETIAKRLLGYTGPPGWEDINTPTDIGLKASYSSNSDVYELDPAKIVRFLENTAIINQTQPGLVKKYLSYNFLKEKLQLEDVDFSLGFHVPITLSLTHTLETGQHGAIVGKLTTNRGAIAPDITTRLFGINVENNTVFNMGEYVSNSTGQFIHILPRYTFSFAIFGISELFLSYSYDYITPIYDSTAYADVPINGEAMPTIVTSSNMATGKFVSIGTEMNEPGDTQTIISLQQNPNNTDFGGYQQTILGTFSEDAIAVEFPVIPDSFSLVIMIVETAADHFIKIDTLPQIVDGDKNSYIGNYDENIPVESNIDEYRTFVSVHGILLEAILHSWSGNI